MIRQPVSIRHLGYAPEVGHSWVLYSNKWLTTTCAKPHEAFAPDEYEFLPVGSHVTCMTCLVIRRP